jgi:hypothetical protein
MLRTCPNCYEEWAGKEAAEASDREWAGSRYLTNREGVTIEIAVEGEDPHLAIFPGRPDPEDIWNTRGWAGSRNYRDRRILHCMVSIPDSGYSLKTMRELTRDTLKNHGLVGGCMIEHPFRQDDDLRFVPDGYIHFHCPSVAFGDVLPGGLELDGDVVFKVIPDPKEDESEPDRFNGFRRKRELRRAIKYALTHCGLREGHHALTWWGELSYNMLSTGELEKFDPELGKEAPIVHLCPYCGSENTEPCEVFDFVTATGGRGPLGIHPSPGPDSLTSERRGVGEW